MHKCTLTMTSNAEANGTDVCICHELDASCLPNTFPRVTKSANPIRVSISSIFLDGVEGERGENQTKMQTRGY